MDYDSLEQPVAVVLWHPTRRSYHQFVSLPLFFRWAADHLHPRSGAGVHLVDHDVRAVRLVWCVFDEASDRWVITDDEARVIEKAPLEPLSTERQRVIASILESNIARVDQTRFVVLGAGAWGGLPMRPHHDYGYTTPTDGGVFIDAACCPALIEQQTAHLSDTDLVEYVSTVSTRIIKEYGCVEQGRTDEEAVRLVDQLMETGLPTGWQLVLDVEQRVVNDQARALLDGLT